VGSLKKMVAVAIVSTAAAIGLLSAAPASAAPAPPTLQVTAASTGNGIISYEITDIPKAVLVMPGSCATYLIDTIRALPIIAPRFLDSGSDASQMDLSGLLPLLLAGGAVVGGITGGQLGIADGSNSIHGQFGGVGLGAYMVGTVCNLNKFANSAPVLVGPGTGSLAAGSLAAGSLATGSSAS